MALTWEKAVVLLIIVLIYRAIARYKWKVMLLFKCISCYIIM